MQSFNFLVHKREVGESWDRQTHTHTRTVTPSGNPIFQTKIKMYLIILNWS